jgi:replicative DNA helicase
MTEAKPAPVISNIEAEAALMGALMLDNRLIDPAADIVTPEDFAEPLYGRLFTAILKEHSLSKAANPVTLRPYFEADAALIGMGGAGYLAQLTGSGAALIGALDFAGQIAELGARRRFSEALLQCAAECENYERDLNGLAGIAETAIADALKTEGGAQSMSAAKAIEANLDMQYEDSPGVTCGIIPSLDHALGAISPGDSVILAGRPGMGKTALALSYAHGVAKQGGGVCFASLEMRAAQLGGRLACDVLFDGREQIPYRVISENRCSPEQRRAMARAAHEISDWPLWIEDLPHATVSRLAAIVRKHKRRLAARDKTLKLVIVDYLQLLAPDRRGKNLYEETSMVSRGLKSLAKAEGVGVMALCQLSRAVESRPDRRPNNSDLRDSGQIEQDADSICFLLRREEYLKRDEPHPDSTEWAEWHAGFDKVRGKIEFIVTKRRAGETAIGHGLWYGQFQAVRG